MNADFRSKRQKAIADMIRDNAIARQEEVTNRLRELGYTVTQATVSRDLEQLGAVKVKRGGVHAYALPDHRGSSDWAAGRLKHILSEWAESVEAAGNLVIIKTPPASAHLVSMAIDQSDLPEIAGTVSGDDTLFIAVRDGVTVDIIAKRFRELSGR